SSVRPGVVMSKRPAGVKASAVGPPTLATRVSAKSEGRFWADTGEERETATRIVHIVSNRGDNRIETSGSPVHGKRIGSDVHPTYTPVASGREGEGGSPPREDVAGIKAAVGERPGPHRHHEATVGPGR